MGFFRKNKPDARIRMPVEQTPLQRRTNAIRDFLQPKHVEGLQKLASELRILCRDDADRTKRALYLPILLEAVLGRVDAIEKRLGVSTSLTKIILGTKLPPGYDIDTVAEIFNLAKEKGRSMGSLEMDDTPLTDVEVEELRKAINKISQQQL